MTDYIRYFRRGKKFPITIPARKADRDVFGVQNHPIEFLVMQHRKHAHTCVTNGFA